MSRNKSNHASPTLIWGMKTDGTDGTMLSRLICPMKDLINSAGFYFTISGVGFVNR